MSAQKGNILFPLISAVAVLALIIAGYFYVQTHLFSTPTPISSAKDETANWKTLQSIYGFSIDYPANWFITPASKDRLGSLDQIKSYDVSKIKSQKENFQQGQTKLELGKDSQVYNLAGVEERLDLEGSAYISKERTKLNNYSAIKIVVVFEESPGGRGTIYYIEKQYPDIYFIAIYGDMSGNNQEIVDQILSTFKFTEK